MIVFGFLLSSKVQSQSVVIYLCNDCTYRSAKDGETITLMTNGKVKVNEKIKPHFTCSNIDGLVTLRYKGKVVNHLDWQKAQEKGFELIDDRGIGYSLIKCTGNMPPIWELMNPKPEKKPKTKKSD